MIKNPTPNVLFLLHLPPPIHGSSVVGKAIKESKLINNTFNCSYVNLLVSRTVDGTGKAGINKVFRFIVIWFRLLFRLIKWKPDVCYLALTATGAAFYKDVLLVALLRLFGVRRVYHMHNKGVSVAQSKPVNKFLYHFVFANADVILLSSLLYKDIEAFVPVSRIYICPNGIGDINKENISKSRHKETPVQILFLSNLIQSKGGFVLLEACLLLKKKNIQFECVFIGGEGDVTAFQFKEQFKRQRLEENVNYLGKKYGEEKHKA